MLTIDGSSGEGGGQLLRSSLALAMVLGRPIKIEKIRARRSKPGLLRQHLTAIQAAARISRAKVRGAELGSSTVWFEPEEVLGGDYHFSIGTAGSTLLVLQAVLPALMLARGKTRIQLEGGTHNPLAPPYEYFAKTLVPILGLLGVSVTPRLVRPGFFPAGGGALEVEIEPCPGEPCAKLRPVSLGLGCNTGRLVGARILLANLPLAIAERQAEFLVSRTSLSAGSDQHRLSAGSDQHRLSAGSDQHRLSAGSDQHHLREKIHIEKLRGPGPGNAVMLEYADEVETANGPMPLTTIFTGFGEKSLGAETVASQAVQQFREHLRRQAPVDEYLADQLILPFALAGQSSFLTGPLSQHARSQVELLQVFGVEGVLVEEVAGLTRLAFGPSPSRRTSLAKTAVDSQN